MDRSQNNSLKTAKLGFEDCNHASREYKSQSKRNLKHIAAIAHLSIQKSGGEVVIEEVSDINLRTSRSTRSFVFDDVDFINNSKLLKHFDKL